MVKTGRESSRFRPLKWTSQQSRFLALVGNYEMFKELSEEAYNSQDAALLQTLKTMDSIETKLNQFKTTLQEFYTSTGIETVIKGALDGATELLSLMNSLPKIGEKIPVTAITIAVTLVRTIKNLATNTIKSINSEIQAKTKQISAEIQNEAQQTSAKVEGAFKSPFERLIAKNQIVQGLGSIVTLLGAVAAEGERAKQIIVGLGTSITGLGQIASGNPLGIVSGILSLASGIASVLDGIIETTEEKIDRLTEEVQESSNEALVKKDEFKTLKDYRTKLNELSKTQYDSNEARQEWLDLNNEIAEKYPELISYIDGEGNALIDTANNWNKLSTARLEAAKAAREAASNQIELADTENQAAEEEYQEKYQQILDLQIPSLVVSLSGDGIENITPELKSYVKDYFSIIEPAGNLPTVEEILAFLKNVENIEGIDTLTKNSYLNGIAQRIGVESGIITGLDTISYEELLGSFGILEQNVEQTQTALEAAQKNFLLQEIEWIEASLDLTIDDRAASEFSGVKRILTENLQKEIDTLIENSDGLYKEGDYESYITDNPDYAEIYKNLSAQFDGIIREMSSSQLAQFEDLVNNPNLYSPADYEEKLKELDLTEELQNEIITNYIDNIIIPYNNFQAALDKRFNNLDIESSMNLIDSIGLSPQYLTDLLDVYDFFITQYNDGLRVTAENSINALETLLKIVGQQSGDIQGEIENILFSGDVTSWEGIQGIIDKIEDIKTDEDLTSVVQSLRTLQDSVVFNTNTFINSYIEEVTDLVSELGDLGSKLAKGLSLEDANKIFSSVDTNLSFDKFFNFDALEEGYSITRAGLSDYLKTQQDQIKNNYETALIELENKKLPDDGLPDVKLLQEYSKARDKGLVSTPEEWNIMIDEAIQELNLSKEQGKNALRLFALNFSNFTGTTDEIALAVQAYAEILNLDIHKIADLTERISQGGKIGADEYRSMAESAGNFDPEVYEAIYNAPKNFLEELSNATEGTYVDLDRFAQYGFNTEDLSGYEDNIVTNAKEFQNSVLDILASGAYGLEEAADALKQLNESSNEIDNAILNVLSSADAVDYDSIVDLWATGLFGDIDDIINSFFTQNGKDFLLNESGISSLTNSLSEESKTLALDYLTNYKNSIIDSINNLLSGSGTFTDFSTISNYFQDLDLSLETDLQRTSDGLKLTENSITTIYNKLKEVDSLAAQIMLENLAESALEADEKLNDIFYVMDEIERIEGLGDISDNKALSYRLDLLKQINKELIKSEDSFNFMNRDLPSIYDEPLSAWEGVNEAFNIIDGDDFKAGRMNYQDFYNMITFLGDEFVSTALGFENNAYTAADLLLAGASALESVNGETFVNLDNLGENFQISADGLKEGITEGMHSLAESQIEMLDGAIKFLEGIVAMEKLQDIDLGENGILDFSDFSKNFFGDNLEVNKTSEAYEALKVFGNELVTINGETKTVNEVLSDLETNLYEGTERTKVLRALYNQLLEGLTFDNPTDGYTVENGQLKINGGNYELEWVGTTEDGSYTFSYNGEEYTGNSYEDALNQVKRSIFEHHAIGNDTQTDSSGTTTINGESAKIVSLTVGSTQIDAVMIGTEGAERYEYNGIKFDSIDKLKDFIAIKQMRELQGNDVVTPSGETKILTDVTLNKEGTVSVSYAGEEDKVVVEDVQAFMALQDSETKNFFVNAQFAPGSDEAIKELLTSGSEDSVKTVALNVETNLQEAADSIQGAVDSMSSAMSSAAKKIESLGEATKSIQNKGPAVQATANAINNLRSKTVSANVKVNVSVSTPAGAKGTISISDDKGSAVTSGSSLSKTTRLAKAKGGVAAASGQKTLMGELGPELVVSNGRYFLVGTHGAEFVNLAKDSIVFNHLQTQSLMNNGYSSYGKAITNERIATSYAKGTGPAKASAQEALAELLRIRAMWQQLLDASAQDLGKKAGSGGGGGGGGGGGSEENKAYIHDLERWYNLLRQIDNLESHITYEQARRENLQKGYSYVDSLEKELEYLKEQEKAYRTLSSLQKDFYDKRREDLLSTNFSQIFTYTEEGLMQYVDGENKGLDILAKLNQTDPNRSATQTAKEQVAYLKSLGFTDKELRSQEDGSMLGSKDYEEIMQNFWNKVDGWMGELDELYDSYNEKLTDVEENLQEQNEILQQYIDNQLSVEEKLLTAIVDREQALIDKMQNELDILQRTSEEYISGLNNALNKERQLYSDNTSDAETARLQRQLAILQRSGGSTSEIKNLQDQIDARMQEDYFNTVQQQIDAIQEASDNQIEKLQTQIDIATESLEYQKENGLLWEEVHQMMTEWTPEKMLDFIETYTKSYQENSGLQNQEDSKEILKELEIWTAKRDLEARDKSWEDFYNSISNKYSKDVLEQNKDKAQEAFNAAYASDGQNAAKNAATAIFDAAQKSTVTKPSTPNLPSSEDNDGGEKQNGSLSGGQMYVRRTPGGKKLGIVRSGKKFVAVGYKDGWLKVEDADIGNKKVNGYMKYSDYKKYYKGIDISKLPGYSKGGLVDYTGLAVVHGSKQKPESYLSAEHTALLKDTIFSKKDDSLYSIAQQLGSFVKDINSIENNSDNKVVIENIDLSFQTGTISNDYDARKAGQIAMNEILKIAAKAGNSTLSRR